MQKNLFKDIFEEVFLVYKRFNMFSYPLQRRIDIFVNIIETIDRFLAFDKS